MRKEFLYPFICQEDEETPEEETPEEETPEKETPETPPTEESEE